MIRGSSSCWSLGVVVILQAAGNRDVGCGVRTMVFLTDFSLLFCPTHFTFVNFLIFMTLTYFLIFLLS